LLLLLWHTTLALATLRQFLRLLVLLRMLAPRLAARARLPRLAPRLLRRLAAQARLLRLVPRLPRRLAAQVVLTNISFEQLKTNKYGFKVRF
jgi:hypothetical protein